MAFTLGDLPVIAIAIVVGVIVLGFGAKILDQIDDDMTANTTAYLIVGNGTSALGKIGKQLPTLGLVIVAALIIGIVATSFYMGRRS